MGERTHRRRRTPRHWAGLAALAAVVLVVSLIVGRAMEQAAAIENPVYSLTMFAAAASALVCLIAAGMALATWGWKAVTGA
jgi:hypothetical protein